MEHSAHGEASAAPPGTARTDGRPHEGGFPTLNEAQRAAARRVPTAIQWDTR